MNQTKKRNAAVCEIGGQCDRDVTPGKAPRRERGVLPPGDGDGAGAGPHGHARRPPLPPACHGAVTRTEVWLVTGAWLSDPVRPRARAPRHSVLLPRHRHYRKLSLKGKILESERQTFKKKRSVSINPKVIT